MRSNGNSIADGASALGAALRTRRRQLGLTQEDLAGLAGCGVAFLYELERGKPTARLDKVVAVLRVVGLELRVAEGKRGLAVDDARTGGPGA